MRVILRSLNTAERRIFAPHVDALRVSLETLDIVARALEPRMAAGVKFDVDTLSYYVEGPDPELPEEAKP